MSLEVVERNVSTITEIKCIYCEGSGKETGKLFLEDIITWCKCPGEEQSFGSYPQYDECSCGVRKEHVHCGTCGNIYQIG